MRRITYLELFHTTVIVIVLLALIFVMHPFDDAEKRLSVGIWTVVTAGIFTIIFTVFQLTLKNKNSLWFRPVSTRVSAILVNSVVLMWLCLVGLTVFVLLKNRNVSNEAVATVFFVLFVAAVCGRYLQKRFSSNTLLAYGISSIGALIMLLLLI